MALGMSVIPVCDIDDSLAPHGLKWSYDSKADRSRPSVKHASYVSGAVQHHNDPILCDAHSYPRSFVQHLHGASRIE